MKENKEGYIYIYKCIVGSSSDVCKIGVTKHLGDNCDRLLQHGRTLYYGFVPYTDFITGKPISTGFKVKEDNKCDILIKKYFNEYQFSKIEIYNIEYEDAIKKIYNILKQNNQLINVIEDGYTKYDFLYDKKEEKELEDVTNKQIFETLKNEILEKYNNSIPDQLEVLLRDKDDYKLNCKSHYLTHNFIEFPNNMILDLNYNKIKRIEIKNKLIEIIDNIDKI